MKIEPIKRPFGPKEGHRHSEKYAKKNISKQCICVTCNGTFTVTHVKKYCSPECNPNMRVWDRANRYCTTCGSEYKPYTRHQKYCKRACQPYRKGGQDKYYQSKEWKVIRATFITLNTTVNGLPISNKYCIECYRKQGRLNDMYAVDHIVRRADGGSNEYANLQSLCRYHHQSKSALEGNSTRTNHGGRPRKVCA